jgi:mRNA-degrading endonuclease RelE of RelBE toxin-antitoxin system
LAWTIDYTQTAEKQLKRLDKPVARRILYFLADRIEKLYRWQNALRATPTRNMPSESS